MKKFADFVQERLRKEGLYSGPVLSLSKTDRYVMYKAGPVLSVNVSFSSNATRVSFGNNKSQAFLVWTLKCPLLLFTNNHSWYAYM